MSDLRSKPSHIMGKRVYIIELHTDVTDYFKDSIYLTRLALLSYLSSVLFHKTTSAIKITTFIFYKMQQEGALS